MAKKDSKVQIGPGGTVEGRYNCGNIQATVWDNNGKISVSFRKGYKKRDAADWTNLSIPLYGLELDKAIAVLEAARTKRDELAPMSSAGVVDTTPAETN